MIKIMVPPGIGDLSWIISKLMHLNEEMHVQVATRQVHRAAPFLELFPNVVKAEYGKFDYNAVVRGAVDPVRCRDFKNKFVSLNKWLEQGNRLERAWPYLPTNFHYDVPIPSQYVEQAERLGEKTAKYKYAFGIHTSGWTGPVKAWGGWFPQQWHEFILDLRKTYNFIPMIIGADFDKPFTDELASLLNQSKVEYVYCVGYHIGVALHLLKKCADFVMSFNSGIPILSNVMRIPVYMQYPKKHDKLRYSWPSRDVPYIGEFFEPVKDTLPKVRNMLKSCLDG